MSWRPQPHRPPDRRKNPTWHRPLSLGKAWPTSARNLLGCFLFRGDDVFKEVGVLSGGERSRVALVRMLVRPANFLILDEPTNHLDMKSQDILQKALIDYPGTLLIVSHNRDFLDPIVAKTLEFRPSEDPRLFHGNLTYYLEKTESDGDLRSPSQNNKKTSSPASTPSAPSGQSSKERRKQEAALRQKRNTLLKPLQQELETLEENIAQLESAQATLLQHLESPEVTSDAEKLQETTNAYQNISQKLETAYSDWTTLSDKIERTEASLS